MPKILACVNLKGGVGKTALAVNLSAYAGLQGYKVLLIDLDPQTNATFSTIGVEAWEAHTQTKGTVADLLGARSHTRAEPRTVDIRDVIVHDDFEGLDVIPSHLDLFSIDLDLGSATARETRLRRAIQPIQDEYDLIVCDCPPNLTIPTQNAIVASTHFVVPISPDFLSALGVALLINRVETLSQDLEHEIENAGIVISRVGRPARHREQTIETLRSQFGEIVLEHQLTERVRVSEAAASHIPIFDTDDQLAVQEFTLVSESLFSRIGINP